MSSKSNPQAKNTDLPLEGFIRLSEVLKLLPVSKSAWYRGISEGKYPRPFHLGPKTSLWHVQDIRQLFNKIQKEGSNNA